MTSEGLANACEARYTMHLKILFSESSPNLGGQELQLLQQMTALKQRGVAVKLACRPNSGIYQAEAARAGNRADCV